ncbi:MAG TPA: Mut7-C RNAse domain-containing protein [Anaerolineales bacterium]|nr:Mut7-C RNAse domain-containing protein [Anaerolineales bacterium]
MPRASFRFYAELNDFLLAARRMVEFNHAFQGRVSIKDMIESLGVPHTEVDLILVNGLSVDFAYIVQADDRVSVYPVFEALDITPLVRLRPRPLREPKFILDTHLGRLANYLRLLGFDTLYRNNYDDEALARLSAGEKRTLLTKDRGLLKRRIVTHGYCVRSADPQQQIKEVLERFDLLGAIAPFSRCLRCNGRLEPVEKQAIVHRLPARTSVDYDEFYRCTACDQLYWPGSHYVALERFVSEILTGR